jgi:hypothetical protein
MLKAKAGAPLGDAAFADDHTLRARTERVADKRPFFETRNHGDTMAQSPGAMQAAQAFEADVGSSRPACLCGDSSCILSGHALPARPSLPFVVFRRRREQA